MPQTPDPLRQGGALDAIQTGKPFLNAVPTMESLIRDYCVSIAEVREAYDEDKLTAEQANQAVAGAAAKLQETLYGRDGQFGTTTWNRPEEMGRWLVKRLSLTDPPEDAAGAAALMLANEVLGLIVAVESGQVQDGEWEWQTDAMIENYTHIFLGLPET